MGSIERLACATEADFTEKSVDYIEDHLVRFQDTRPGNFVLGFTGANGSVRRSRVADMMTSLARRRSIDWGRVYVFLVDERFGFERDEDCNAHLIREHLLKPLKRNHSHLPEDHLVVPNTSLATVEECARDYTSRLRDLLEREAPDGPHLVTIGLGKDRSIAGIFPEWYQGSAERWGAATRKDFGVICTETKTFEVSRRVTVNLRVIRNAGQIILYLGDGSDQAWKQVRQAFDESIANHSQSSPSKRARLTSSPVNYGMEGSMLVIRSLRSGRREAPAPCNNRAEGTFQPLPVSPLGYVLTHGRVTVVQLKVDLENHHAVIILGAAGDLAKKKTFVALFHLHLSRCLPTTLSIVGCDDSQHHPDVTNVEELWDKRLKTYLELEGMQHDLQEFRARLSYMPLEINSVQKWRALDEHICRLSRDRARDNRIFYLALPPFLFGDAVQHIRQECWSNSGFSRVVVEKPFGWDLQEARKLCAQLSQHLDESQIFRIDHYLAKTLVLNIITLRFANREFGRLFHADCIANVRITFKEDIGVEGRAGYFDRYGIIRDIMQNHLMQVLALIAMEAPASLHAEAVRDEKVKVLRQIRCIDAKDCVIGQYDGYLDDPGIKQISEAKGYPSRTPTFAVVVLYLDNERWSGVPFILKAGKFLENRHTIVRVQFKKAPPSSLFGDQPQNELLIRIQPNETIYYKMLAKMPGLNQKVSDVQQTVLDMDLKKRFELRRLPEAYEKLIHDVIQGESHNFVRKDELEEAWRIFDPLLKTLEVDEARVPERYCCGSRGPASADALIDRMGFRRYTVSGVPGFAEDDFG